MSSRPRRAQYSRVEGSDPSSSKSVKLEARRKARSAAAEEYAVKLHAILWVLGGVASAWYSEILSVCRSSEKVNRVWFNLGLFFFTVASILVLYMAVWVPRVLKSDVDPSVYSPKMIPFTAISSVLSAVFLIVGLWPVYGLFTPGLLGVLWIASLMSAHFLPAM